MRVRVRARVRVRVRVRVRISTTKATVNPSDMPVIASLWYRVCSSMKTHL